jgi:predicted RND superfamily exporter protein
VRTDVDEVSRRIVPWLIRCRRPVLFAAALCTALGVLLSVRLYGDLRSGLEELLPETAPSVVAARKLGPLLHGTTRLSVDLEGADADAIARFADDLAVRLRALPAELVESVDYRSDEEDGFLRRFGLLYVAEPDLVSIRDRIAARVAWEKRAANPLAADLEGEALEGEASAPPPVDFADLEARYGVGGPGRFRNGYYQTRDGRNLVLQVRVPETSTGLDRNRRLLEAVQREVAGLVPSSYDPKLRVGYSAEVAELVEEQAALVADLLASTGVVTVLVLLALWLFFRRWTAICAVLAALGAGCALTFGIGDLLIGHLNANTAFLGSIILGNGINVAIIVVGRFLEERRSGAGVDESIRVAWARTLPATFVASFGAGLAYLSLGATAFRGFSQFGAIGALGMALCWICAYLLLPPLLFILESGRAPAAASCRERGAAFCWLARCIEARPAAFICAGAAIVLGCGAAMSGYRGQMMEHDLSKLRARQSVERGAAHWAEKADRVFEAYLTPVVLWSDTEDGLARVVAALEARRTALGKDDPFREVTSLASVVPDLSAQQRKLALLAEIRGLLPDRLVNKFEPGLRRKVLALRPASDIRAVSFSDLPAALRRALSERDGRVGRVALAFPRKVSQIDLADVEDMKRIIRGAFADAGSQALAYNSLFLLSDIDDAIWRDGPKATGFAFLLVCVLVVLVMRRARDGAIVVGGLLVGFVGLIGVAAAAHVRVNFLNFVVLPITLGIGVDYAVNIVLRHREERCASEERCVSIVRTLRETGGAVALCSATTIIGYGSLMVADNQALAGFGLLASLGEITCLLAALVIVPAWLTWRRRVAPFAIAEVLPAFADFGNASVAEEARVSRTGS